MSENAADPDLARLLRLGPCRAPERRKPIRSTVPSGASVLLSGCRLGLLRPSDSVSRSDPFPF
jgi:hypothetical protein